MSALVSVDTGGTHTDIVVIDAATKRLITHKVPTTPSKPSEGVLNGVASALAHGSLNLADVERLVYGTTVVTNLIIERGANLVALVTTRNFRDILAMGRAYRDENIYDLHWRPAKPLVPRRLRFGVTERISAQGEVLEPLDHDEVHAALAEIVSQGIQSVAVCLLNSYVNPVHERQIADIARREFPELKLSVSAELLREFREYERTATTVANAFVMGPIDVHLSDLADGLANQGLVSAPYIMRANGGAMSFGAAKQQPVSLAHSGPMGGIIGAAEIARQNGIRDLISFDMGGTSSDVSLISDATPSFTTRNTVAGVPVKLPSLDLVTVGAGGGSIAWLDAASGLKVGPKSAGAEPGPACYGKGGTEPTVTDANLLLGRLNPDWFLDGARPLNRALAAEAVRRLADRLGLEMMATARGIIAISEGHMVNAIKLSSVKRGMDPREMTLVGFGGAGPLHVIGLARELGIRHVIVPCAPGNMSALGMLSADSKQDFVISIVRDLDDLAPGFLQQKLEEILVDARAWLSGEPAGGHDCRFIKSVELRYKGQTHELNLPLSDSDQQGTLAERFHAEHRRVFGYSMPNVPAQATNIRVTAVGHLPKVGWERTPDPRLAGPQGEREIWFEGDAAVPTAVWRAEGLSMDEVIEGPAVVEFPGSTFIMPRGWRARCDALGHLHVDAVQ